MLGRREQLGGTWPSRMRRTDAAAGPVVKKVKATTNSPLLYYHEQWRQRFELRWKTFSQNRAVVNGLQLWLRPRTAANGPQSGR